MKKLTMNKNKKEESSKQSRPPIEKESHESLSKSNTSTEGQDSKPKKSLFPKFMKRRSKRGTPRQEKTPEVQVVSGVQFENGSSSSQEYKLSEFQYTDIPGDPEKTDQHEKFIRKFMKSSISCQNVDDVKFVEQCSLPTVCNQRFTQKLLYMNNLIPTTYVPKCDTRLVSGIYELHDILEQLQNSEAHMIKVVKTYVTDANVKRELLQTSFNYFALQFESKTQTASLSNKLWLQHLDVNKNQENDVKKRLHFLVQQNRHLQTDLEELCRQCEKFADKNRLYPKRYLQMRSFGKTYAKHLVDNNKKLYGKVKSLTEIVCCLEEEVYNLQGDNETLEKEKIQLKSQIYSLESSNVRKKFQSLLIEAIVAFLAQTRNDHDLEKTILTFQVKSQGQIIDDCERGSKSLLKELCLYEQHLKGLSITVNLQKYQNENYCLPELIHQLRACVSEIMTELIEAYGNASLMVKDVHKLRDTNARLQENLQKSTSELDNLSKKIQSNSSIENRNKDISALEQENIELKQKIEDLTRQLSKKEKEFATKMNELKEAYKTINHISAEKLTMRNQVEDIFALFNESTGCDNVSRQLLNNNEKLEQLRNQLVQKNAEHIEVSTRCRELEKENQDLLQSEQLFQQELTSLNESMTLLASEYEILKKQLSSEHQTVLSLQGERVKYLEEKNVLRTIFQHLKAELSRVQQLEGAIADMTKETSRLTLIAEFNKQLGEQLKNEVEIKDNTIAELRQNIEKLSHLQIDNDKEKFTLFMQLSEISCIKDKLSESLELELRRYMELDETKKQLENNTRSQLKLFEEMQKNERTALKEMLQDFKVVIKQRNALLKLNEETKQKNHDLETLILHLRQQLDSAHIQATEKCEEYKTLVEKLQEQEMLIKSWEEKSDNHSTKYDKTVRKLEKLVIQMRKEKEELESSNTYLKTNIQKMHADLNEARNLEIDASNKLAMKMAEAETYMLELEKFKNDLQSISQENGRMKMELEYLNKLCERQTNDLQAVMSQFSSKDNMYLESKTSEISKESEINKLSRAVIEQECKINQLLQECDMLRKENQQQNRILMGYEDQLILMPDLQKAKVELEAALHSLRAEHETVRNSLEISQKDYENLKMSIEKGMYQSEQEKLFYKNQAEELLAEYNDQKRSIEDEISNISQQLYEVTESLTQEKKRFEDLSEAHADLKRKFVHLRESFTSEVSAHKETCRKMADLDEMIKSVESDRDKLQEDVQLLVEDLNEEKAINVQFRKENDELHQILEHGKQQYSLVTEKCYQLEQELIETNNKLESCKIQEINEVQTTETGDINKSAELEAALKKIESLQKELDDNQKMLSNFKEEFFSLQKDVTSLEFKNCEMTLQLHETEGRLETERNLYKQLKEEYDKNMTKFFKMEDGSKLLSSDSTFY